MEDKRRLYKQPVEWSLLDFVGKYHLNRMATDTPVPGTAIRVERERQAFMEKRANALKEVINDMEARRAIRVVSKTRKAAVIARVEVQATVGHKMNAGQHERQTRNRAPLFGTCGTVRETASVRCSAVLYIVHNFVPERTKLTGDVHTPFFSKVRRLCTRLNDMEIRLACGRPDVNRCMKALDTHEETDMTWRPLASDALIFSYKHRV